MSAAAETVLRESTVASARTAIADHGAELKRGAWTNTLAMFASNFRGIFTFLIARMLGPAALGTFSVAWATTDILTNVGNFGLEDTITAFIARAQAKGDHARARALARLGIFLALAQCTVLALIAIIVVRLSREFLGLDARMADAICVLLCAMPGVSLYRLSTAVSRGMKVMRHDIFSRGMTEPIITTLAFLAMLALGFTTFAPQLGAIIGTAASGIVALTLALSLFRRTTLGLAKFSPRAESRRLLAFSAQLTSYELLNSLIVRVDVIMLGCFIGKAPGVTLPIVGIYGAVVEVAGGLRKVNQIFNPIFRPVIAGMCEQGGQERVAATFSRVAQWMLWILLPLVAALSFAGPTVLMIYGPAFAQGGAWLAIVALACALNAFVSLAETVIMVQRPRLNLLNSAIACAITLVANFFFIRAFGATGAAFGILLPYVLLGVLRYRALRYVFEWPNPWRGIGRPLLVAIAATVPALACRLALDGMRAQIIAVAAFAIVYFIGWKVYREPVDTLLA